MRPVNLIPPEQRRGDRAPLRSGPVSYMVVGLLAAVLVGVTALVMAQNGITDRESEVAALQVRLDEAQQEAQALKPYADFASLEQSRMTTIVGLAKSRFDWERVLRELALVIPADVSLTSLQGNASNGNDVGGAAAAPGAGTPVLVVSGCAPGHVAVAGFLAAMEDIDGVTRVGLESSTGSEAQQTEVSGASTSTPSSGGCPRGKTFSAKVVFDDYASQSAATGAVPVDPAVSAAGTPTAPVADNSQSEQIQQSQQAVNLVAGSGG